MKPVNYSLGEYNDGGSILPKGAFRISPSSIGNFFSEKRAWYGEKLLGEEIKFKGSTSSELGNIVHHITEVIANCKITGEEYNSAKLHTAIEEYIDLLDTEKYDTSLIHSLWKNMGEMLVKEYVLEHNTLITEPFVYHEILPGIFPSGSIDAITSSSPTDTWENALNGTETGVLTVRDFKTASSKPSSMSYSYTLQIYTYAYILRKMGVNITEVELCFVVRPTKTLPVRTFNFKKPFDDQAYNFIESILKLIADSVQCFKDWPDLQYILAGDYRLKKNEIPRPE